MKMQEWLIMGGALLLVCLFVPAFAGLVVGAGAVMLLTVLLYKLLGG